MMNAAPQSKTTGLVPLQEGIHRKRRPGRHDLFVGFPQKQENQGGHLLRIFCIPTNHDVPVEAFREEAQPATRSFSIYSAEKFCWAITPEGERAG